MTDVPSGDPAADPAAPAPTEPPGSARELFRHRDYLLFWVDRFAGTLGGQVQGVALGWQMYNLARQTHDVATSSFYVGLIGLAAFLPVLLLTLVAGEAADRHDRRKVLLLCFAGEIVTVGLLAVATWRGFASIPLLLATAFAFGGFRAFFAPASSALGPMLVPRHLLPRAIAWNSLAWQTASILGPTIAGLLVAVNTSLAYVAAFVLYLTASVAILLIRGNTKPDVQPGSRWQLVKEGLVYTWRNRIVFGAISLDLFAVLLGGATALLPVYARDILHVGPEGFGILRAGPAIGATLVAVVLASYPIRRWAGLIMFGGVFLFGLATVVFALSKVFWVSVVALAVLGGADMVSVYVRSTLIQIVTPDHMRGRVSSASYLFIGASNELGEFQSGVAARLLGPVGAALFGGIGAMVVTVVWARLFPQLRKADRLA
jgi:MFS family permease